MKVLLTAKVGTFLVVSSVLAVWALLVAQHVQAHTTQEALPIPSCSGLPDDAFFDDAQDAIATLTSMNPDDDTVETKKGTGETGTGNTRYHYAKIVVPALIAGKLMVSDSGNGPSDAILCGRREGNVTSRTNYSDHDNALRVQASTTAAQVEATADAAKPNTTSPSTLRSDLRAAANALGAAATALRRFRTTAADGAADTAEMNEMTADGIADDTNSDADALIGALGDAAGHLTTAANDLGTAAGVHMGFGIDTLISSGDEEYVVVVAVPASATDTPDLDVMFDGVMATAADEQNGQDEGSFTENNQRITHILETTNMPGLLTVRTTGNEVNTIGTLQTGGADVAMDEPSGGNFEIVSPVKAGTTYSVFVDGQTRSERGDYGLEVEFGVADNLSGANAAAYANTPDHSS